MCFYRITVCPTFTSKDLFKVFFGPGFEIYRPNISRCHWWSNFRHQDNASIQGKLCPYMIVRHGPPMQAEKRDLACFAQDEEGRKRGCVRCWEKIREKGWPEKHFAAQVGGLKGDSEPGRHSVNWVSDGDGDLAHGNQHKGGGADASNSVLGDRDTHDEVVEVLSDSDDDDDDDDDAAASEVTIQDHLNANASATNRFRRQAISCTISASAGGKAPRAYQPRSVFNSSLTVQKTPARSSEARNSIKKRREELEFARAQQTSEDGPPEWSRQASTDPKSPGQKDSPFIKNGHKFNKPSPVAKRQKSYPSGPSKPSREDFMDPAEPKLAQPAEDVYEKLRDAVLAVKAVVGKCDEVDNGEQEMIHAVNDGSFRDALSKHCPESTVNQNSQFASNPRLEGSPSANRAPNVSRWQRLSEEVRLHHEEVGLLRANVTRLRREKVEFIDRLAILLDEKSAAVAREAALHRRLKDVEVQLLSALAQD